MDRYIITLNNQRFIVKDATDRGIHLERANFLGLGVALCGILQGYETIEEFDKRIKHQLHLKRLTGDAI